MESTLTGRFKVLEDYQGIEHPNGGFPSSVRNRSAPPGTQNRKGCMMVGGQQRAGRALHSMLWGLAFQMDIYERV